MGLEYSGYIDHITEDQLPWKIDDAKADVQQAREQLLILAASIPEDTADEEGNVIDREERVHIKFNAAYDYLFESIIQLFRLESAKEHLEFERMNIHIPIKETQHAQEEKSSPQPDQS